MLFLVFFTKRRRKKKCWGRLVFGNKYRHLQLYFQYSWSFSFTAYFLLEFRSMKEVKINRVLEYLDFVAFFSLLLCDLDNKHCELSSLSLLISPLSASFLSSAKTQTKKNLLHVVSAQFAWAHVSCWNQNIFSPRQAQSLILGKNSQFSFWILAVNPLSFQL